MRGYTRDQARAALIDAGVSPGEILCVHSSLFALGPMHGVSPRELPAMLAALMMELIGPDGTLVVPMLNFGFCKGERFDRQRTPAVKMGALTDHVSRMPGAKRSPHPMQGVAAVGARAVEICAPDTPGAFDEGGPWWTMMRANARSLLLGTTMQFATVFHLPEQEHGVPYRYFKDFSAPYVDGGRESVRTYRLYVRDLSIDPHLVLEPIAEALRATGEWRDVPLGSGMIQSALFQPISHQVKRMLAEDPWIFVSNRPAAARES